jgi:gamma-glutamyltranspeptidase/glutathione hydrolase
MWPTPTSSRSRRSELIDPAYLDVRATEVFAPDEHATPGDPGIALGRGPMRQMWGEDPTEHRPGTTHFSIIDPYGNAVSMTMTVEAAFGNSVMVHGFMLNNQLTDFSREPTKGGKPVANAVAGSKRPRSSMSPTLVFDPEGDLFMVTGSPGGNSIVAYVAKTLVGVLEWGKSAQEAINLPNIIARGDVVGVEVDREGGPEAAEALRELGYSMSKSARARIPACTSSSCAMMAWKAGRTRAVTGLRAPSNRRARLTPRWPSSTFLTPP